MDFENFKEEAANYLEDAGFDSEKVPEEKLYDLWMKKIKPAHVVAQLNAQGVI